jgi:hypothetical protein
MISAFANNSKQVSSGKHKNFGSEGWGFESLQARFIFTRRTGAQVVVIAA